MNDPLDVSQAEDASPGEFSGLVALITGAGAAGDGIGNGRAAAILMARSGASVLAIDTDLESAERTVEMISEAGGSASAFRADVTSEHDCRAMVDFAVDRYGKMDILVNNVGIGSSGSAVTMPENDWESCVEYKPDLNFSLLQIRCPRDDRKWRWCHR